MKIVLEAIMFNHGDPATGALNIRRNETEFVTLPEWRQGISIKPEDSPAAYAIRETRGRQITIQAKFKCTDNQCQPVRVRAVDAKESLQARPGCGLTGMILSSVQPALFRAAGAVLGTVKEKRVEFNASGESDFETFELQDVQLSSVGVSASTIKWRWQYSSATADDWIDFAITSHRIYTVLEVPKCPWEQTPHNSDNTQLPWADALEYACAWAVSAQDLDTAATLVTKNVYDLGMGLVTYDGGVSNYACPNFDCSKFLKLLRDGVGMGQTVNCSDCATIVSSFANLLGCQLWQSSMGQFFQTNPIKVIGSRGFTPTLFVIHEVAWKGEAQEDDEVFDACLMVDGDDNPSASPFDPLLSTNLRFGAPDEKGYRFRLALRPDCCIPLPSLKQRRKIGLSFPGGCESFDDRVIEFLKQLYNFEEWSNISPLTESLFVEQLFLDKLIFPDWTLADELQHPKMQGEVEVTQSLWGHKDNNPNMLLRIDSFQCRTWQDARFFMLQRLRGVQVPDVERFTQPPIGDVAFVKSGEVAVLFARSEFVFMVRSVGREPVPITEIAFQLDQRLI